MKTAINRQNVYNAFCNNHILLPSVIIFQRYILEKPAANAMPSQQEEAMRREPTPDIGPYRDTETQKLKELVEQRDNEISILKARCAVCKCMPY